MKPMIQLHLEVEREKPESTSPPEHEHEEAEPVVTEERVRRMLNRAAHKAGTEFRRSGGGIFSK